MFDIVRRAPLLDHLQAVSISSRNPPRESPDIPATFGQIGNLRAFHFFAGELRRWTQGTGVQPAPLFQAENTTAGTVRSLVAAEPVSAML